MKKISQQKWPEIVFGTFQSAGSQAIRRAMQAGQLRKIAPRLYTGNLTDSIDTIVRRNCYQILGGLFPGAIITHRSALEGGVSPEGLIVLTFKYTKKITLPGLVVHLYKGKGPQPGDTPFMEKLFLASRARALLENLQPSRGKDKKNVSLSYIEVLLDKLCRVYGEEELNRLRDEARRLANLLSLQKEFVRLEKIIGALLGSQLEVKLTTEVAQARASGYPYDANRLELFTQLFSVLKKEILPVKKEIIVSTQQLYNLAFFEAYFSNYIEGTEFEVDEAADIIFHHKLMPNRPEDAHDITATFEIVANTTEMNRVPSSANELIQLLKKRHKKLMDTRLNKQPGQFKTIANRVGNTLFVIPELVEGTLLKAFSLYENLPEGIPRAIFMMFIVTEIHPFVDGNGRIARIMMNAELVHAGESRIIVPTVYREDYLLALRRLSRSGDPTAYIRMLLRAQAFSSNIDFSDYQKALKQLNQCNAFMQPHEGKLLG
jgi:fido (protein-threonine AMPylation protein)